MAAYAEVAARSNFSLLDGASHPAELIEAAARLGHAGIGLCDTNSLAGVARGHVAAKVAGLRFAVGARLAPEDGSAYFAWLADRAGYGRLVRLLSLGRMTAPKGRCRITRDQLLAHAEGWALALIPPEWPDATFAERLRADAAALRGRLALPLLLPVACSFRGQDRGRLHRFSSLVAQTGTALLASNDVRYHAPERRRLADVLSAIRLGTTVDALGFAAERNAERHLKPAAEMARLFEGHPEALANAVRVLEAASGFSLDQLRHEDPDEILEPGHTAQETLAPPLPSAAILAAPDGSSAPACRWPWAATSSPR